MCRPARPLVDRAGNPYALPFQILQLPQHFVAGRNRTRILANARCVMIISTNSFRDQRWIVSTVPESTRPRPLIVGALAKATPDSTVSREVIVTDVIDHPDW